MFFVALAQALDKDFLDTVPVCMIRGGWGCGKSLAAEILVKRFDDRFQDINLVEHFSQENSKYFLEDAPGSADSNYHKLSAKTCGQDREFWFMSNCVNATSNPKTARRHFRQAGYQKGMIILSTMKYGVEMGSLDVDLEAWPHKSVNLPRTIKTRGNSEFLRMSPRFRSFVQWARQRDAMECVATQLHIPFLGS